MQTIKIKLIAFFALLTLLSVTGLAQSGKIIIYDEDSVLVPENWLNDVNKKMHEFEFVESRIKNLQSTIESLEIINKLYQDTLSKLSIELDGLKEERSRLKFSIKQAIAENESLQSKLIKTESVLKARTDLLHRETEARIKLESHNRAARRWYRIEKPIWIGVNFIWVPVIVIIFSKHIKR